MFCPNCGEKLETPNQRFCAGCGSEIQTTASPEISSQPVEEVQVPSPPAPPPVSTVPVYDSKPVKAQGLGTYSKKCFYFSLVSIGFFVAGFVFGGTILLRFILPLYFFPFFGGGIIMWIIAIVLHLVGFIFGILSRVNSSKARSLEASHALEKVGSVFGVFGIILNVLPMAILPIFIVLGVIAPIIPYYY